MRNFDESYDFKLFGQEIKKARIKNGLTREQLAGIVDLAPRYIMSIENKGQHPSFKVFYQLVTMFHISVDQFFYPEDSSGKTTKRRQLDQLLDGLEDSELLFVENVIQSLIALKKDD